MADPASILNPDNPLLDSDEEDDDFEPEVPITNDGLFVTTRSGKGGDADMNGGIEDVDISLKRKAISLFEEMERADAKENEILSKRRCFGNGFKKLMTTEEDSIGYFKKIADTYSKDTNTLSIPITQEELRKSINEAVEEVTKSQNTVGQKKTVKFAGENIEIVDNSAATESLDTLVKSLESKKSISTIDKSSYDWDKFKDKEGIKEEVEKAKKNGYIDKQAFLSRVDERQFEKERAQRERERIQRENEWRQRQK